MPSQLTLKTQSHLLNEWQTVFTWAGKSNLDAWVLFCFFSFLFFLFTSISLVNLHRRAIVLSCGNECVSSHFTSLNQLENSETQSSYSRSAAKKKKASGDEIRKTVFFCVCVCVSFSKAANTLFFPFMSYNDVRKIMLTSITELQGFG